MLRSISRFGVIRFEVAEIPPAGAREPQIEVTFHVVDATGAFSITARDKRTGRDLPVLQR